VVDIFRNLDKLLYIQITGQRIHEPPCEVEVDPKTASMVLEDLGIDLLDHLEVNGAAVRVPEESITLRDEMVPVQLLGVESQVRQYFHISFQSISGHYCLIQTISVIRFYRCFS
jgi:hypothetical protein